MKIVDIKIEPDGSTSFGATVVVVEEGERRWRTCYGETPLVAIENTLNCLFNEQVAQLMAGISITQSATWK